ncbi:MAG: hypothetical protein JWM21_4701 [Acidobacteria bacterium]|nr:hypothetical protein [Acidobacteriota bacterium]
MSHFTKHRNVRLRSILAAILAVLIQLPLLSSLSAGLAASKNPAKHRGPASGFAPQAEWIRQLPINANDVVYSSLTKKLYVSTPSAAGQNGNSIRTIDPVSGSVDSSTFVGSEPTKLALADDGHSLWVSLDGAAAFRRYDVVSNTLGTQFPIGFDNFYGTLSLSDLAVAPGNPDLVAITRNYRGVSPPEAGVAVFDNGVQRPTTTPGHSAASDFLAFSASATTLYGGGFSSGLNTMTINNSGVSVTSTASFASGNQIRFDNGRVYGTVGQVINPVTGSIVGTFPGVAGSPFTTDSAVGRAYYLTGSQSAQNYSLTLQAFDLNTFLSVGTLTIPGVNGNAGRMVRWGSNGLAFRTDGGQLFLIQTDLIPSGDPVPTPTATPTPSPTPSPTPIDTFVRSVPLTTSDLVYSSATQMIYAALPSSAGSKGNSIAPLNPVDGTVGTPVFIGSEPTKVAISSDGQTIYSSLDGAAAIRKFDLLTQTAGVQFPISAGSPLFANDLAIVPGDSNAVAVSRSNRVSFPDSDGVAIYDNGVRRNNVAGINSFSIEYSNVSTKLYSAGFTGTAGSGAIDRLQADALGVSNLGKVSTLSSGDLRFDNGLLYRTLGDVIDPEAGAGAIKGSFRNLGSLSDMVMTTDSAVGRAYFLNSQYGTAFVTLKAYDLNTYVPLGTVTINIPTLGFQERVTSLVRWGTNGLAFRTANSVYLVQSTLVSSSGAVPTPTPTPSPTPSPSPSPYVPTFVRQLSLPANDLVYNQPDQMIYASVPSFAGPNGNSITPVNPLTGALGTSVFVGSEPNKLALADDGSALHISLDGAAAIRRFNIPTQTAGTQFSWGSTSQRPIDMAVVPGSPLALAISDGTGLGVAVYDDGVRRTNTSHGGAYAIGPIAFGATPSVLYGYDGFSSGFELVKFNIDANGVTGATIGNNLLSGFSNAPMKFANGRLYHESRVVDPEAKILAGSFLNTGGSNPVKTVDPVLGKVFFLSSSGTGLILRAFDSNTFVPLGSVDIPNVPGAPRRIIRWGTNGLAFNTVPPIGQSDTSVNHIYLVQSALVSSNGTIPTGLQLASDKFTVSETSATAGLQVIRSGDVSGSTTVNYATSDITATAGSDYTAVSGTLTFAPGELSKTIAVPILDDSFYEGANETFRITLSTLNGAVFSGPTTAVVTIFDNEFKPTMFITNNLNVLEGNSGSTQATLNVSLSNASVETITVNFATSNSTATAGSDYVATSGTLTFLPGTTTLPINVEIIGDTVDEPDEFLTVTLSNATNVNSYPQFGVSIMIINDDGPPKLQFTSTNYSVSEGAGRAIVTVTRFGRTTDPVSVDYQTSDGSAFQTRDYTIAAGTLQFAVGETTRTFSVLLTDDVYIEANEFLNLTLSNVQGNGASLGSPISSRVTIFDNDMSPPSSNPLDDALMFVRQHYYDFLSRTPDQGGLDYWSGQITQCGNDASCIRAKRIDVSNAFFYELEYQQTGSYVYRLYRGAFGNNQPFPNPFPNSQYPNEEKKLPSYAVFAPDRARVRGGASLAQTQLDLANAFVLRPAFVTRYPANLDGPGFVDAILNTINTDAGADLTSQRDALIAIFNQGGRGEVLYHLADDNEQGNPINNRAFINGEYNRAFVATQYFGYLRRNPDIAGYIFWLGQVNGAPLRDVAKQHAMVCSFITSTEYQQRFSSIVTHNNTECQ